MLYIFTYLYSIVYLLPRFIYLRYGDYSPVTIAGKAFSILLMLGGLFYLTMPITAAASTFYHYHEKYNRRNEVSDQLERAISPSSMEGSKSEAMDATAVGKKEDNGEEELQNDVNATNRNANKPNPSNVSSFRASLVARMSAQLDDNSINTTKVKLHVLMRGLDNINKEINHFFQHIKLPRRKRKSSSGLKEDSECIARFSDNSTADSGSVNMVVLGNFVSTVTTVAHTLDELLRPERENFVQFAKQYSVK